MFTAALASLKDSLLDSVRRIFHDPAEPPLPSVAEPYIPDPENESSSASSSSSTTTNTTNTTQTASATPDQPTASSNTTTTTTMPGKDHETLREKATKKLHGPDANPSMLGDPVSLKAEQSDKDPTPDTRGAQSAQGPSPGKDASNAASASQRAGGGGGNGGGGEKLREKAAKKLHGPDANPSQLGDPISLESEKETKGGAGRGSKL